VPSVAEACRREGALSGDLYLPDSQITASSYDVDAEPWRVRLDSDKGWLAAAPHTKDVDYIQVQFNR
jgi:hypothetical protein